MFGFFRAKSVIDPVLGKLEYSRSYWRGTFSIATYSEVPVVIAGSRAAPEPSAVNASRAVTAKFIEWRTTIEKALYDHYSLLDDAIKSGEVEDPSSQIVIANQSDIWPYVQMSFVSVAPMDRVLTIEFGFKVAWDEEHILGARFQSDKFLELCGSTVSL